MKTVTISTGRVLIHTAAASPGTQRETWRCKFRTVTSRVPKSSIPKPKSIARLPRRFTTCRSVTIPTGRTRFVWGQNNATEEGKTQSFLIESNYQRGRDTVYFRWERVQKSGHELVLKPFDESEIFPVSGYSLGYVRDLSHGKGIDIGLGTQFTINDRPDSLDRYYGDDLGYAFQFFLRIRPSQHSHGAHDHAEQVPGMMK